MGGLAIAFAAGIVLVMLALAGVFEPKVKGERGPARRAAPPDLPLAEVALVRVPREEAAVGTVRAVYEVAIASKLLARVKEVRVKAGQEVKAGEILVLLDESDLKARLEQAQAARTAAEARLEQAKIDLDRGKRLRSQQVISQSEFDQLGTAIRTAQAELERARQAVKEAEIIQDYATVRAPIDGVIVDKKVNAGDTVTPGQTLATMYDPTKMQMVATVRESMAQRLKVGDVIPARLDTLDYTCHATISEIVPEAQAESRSFQVKVTGPCPPNVYSGMFGRIFIPLEEEDVLVVPPEAVRRVGQLDVVDVVEDGQVRRRSVQLGRSGTRGPRGAEGR